MKKEKIAVEQLTDKQLYGSLYLTQMGLLVFGLLALYFLGDDIGKPNVTFDLEMALKYGVFPAFIVIAIDIILMKVLPKDWLDDGGINERIFSKISFPHLLFLTIVIACTEELFFRYTLQGLFGLYVASFIFAILHVRYLNKIVLFLQVVFVSFLIGFVYEQTQNLLTVIIMHFVIDFCSGLIIRYKLVSPKENEVKENEK